MTGSLRAYARYRAEQGWDGQSLASVQRAIQSGRIARNADGGIDFEQADAAWAGNTIPGVNSRTLRHRQAHPAAEKRVKPVLTTAVEQQRYVENPVPAAADREKPIPAAARTGRKRAQAVPEMQSNGFAQARALKEGYLAGLAQLEFKKKSGELIPVADVENEWAAHISAVRNHLLLAPAKIAPKVAAVSDPRECQVIIEREIREALTALAEDHDAAA